MSLLSVSNSQYAHSDITTLMLFSINSYSLFPILNRPTIRNRIDRQRVVRHITEYLRFVFDCVVLALP